jgi:hypothetical protein
MRDRLVYIRVRAVLGAAALWGLTTLVLCAVVAAVLTAVGELQGALPWPMILAISVVGMAATWVFFGDKIAKMWKCANGEEVDPE